MATGIQGIELAGGLAKKQAEKLKEKTIEELKKCDCNARELQLK